MHTVVATLQEIIIPVFGGHKSDRPYQEEGYEKSTRIDYDYDYLEYSKFEFSILDAGKL